MTATARSRGRETAAEALRQPGDPCRLDGRSRRGRPPAASLTADSTGGRRRRSALPTPQPAVTNTPPAPEIVATVCDLHSPPWPPSPPGSGPTGRLPPGRGRSPARRSHPEEAHRPPSVDRIAVTAHNGLPSVRCAGPAPRTIRQDPPHARESHEGSRPLASHEDEGRPRFAPIDGPYGIRNGSCGRSCRDSRAPRTGCGCSPAWIDRARIAAGPCLSTFNN